MVPLLLLLLLAYIVIQLIYSGYYIKNGRGKLSKHEFKREIVIDTANGSKNVLKLFISGDSLAIRLGATAFETFIPGRVSNFFARDNIVEFKNAAVSGAKMRDVLNFPKPKEQQDIIGMIISSNDLLRFTPYDKFEDSTQKVVGVYAQLTDKLIIVGPGRVEDSPIIPIFVKPIYNFRARKYAEIIKEESKKYKNVSYINPREAPEGIVQVKNWQSPDKFHPSDEGQVFWFELVKSAL